MQKHDVQLQKEAQGIKQGCHFTQPTCGVKASELTVDTVDVEPSSNLFAFLDASVGAQRAR